MTELSPAAQAILAAVTQQMYACDPEDLPNESVRVAYTLRLGFHALADRLQYKGVISKDSLTAIATELENHGH